MNVPLTKTAGQVIPELATLQRRSFIAAGAGALLSAVGLLTNAAQFFQSYLMAYMLVLGLTLGSLALGMIHQLSGGAWGVVTRRLFGAASRVMPTVTLLFLPIALGLHQLYEWSHADVVAADPILQAKRLYLNPVFFFVRAALYFLVWNALVYFLNRLSLQQDRSADPRIATRMQRISGAGLLAYVLTITFASFDWLMSLDPHWFSTIYGILILGGQGLTALAFLVTVFVWLSRRAPFDSILVPQHFHDLGNLMLAFVMLWAYFSFSQYLIIWSGNLPEEISWYIYREQTSWRLVGLMLIVFHFALPFLLLLSRRVKREPELLVRIAIGVLCARLIDLFWLIAPAFHHDGLVVSWMDIVLPFTLLSLWLGAFFWQLRGRAILPLHDPQFHEAIGHIIEREAH